jgi:hypothetical protein
VLCHGRSTAKIGWVLIQWGGNFGLIGYDNSSRKKSVTVHIYTLNLTLLIPTLNLEISNGHACFTTRNPVN